ncbi:MAG: magnesium and cobalt transport protein CorA [Actinomycetia bacterium]|nr:magnesium and cobalt transport protein CorA [Actinomycetes bacterium]
MADVADAAVYFRGRRIASPDTLADTYRALRDQPGAMAWIGLYRPDADTLTSLAKQFGLHELAVEDAITAHQRPKLDRYGDTLFMVLRAASYLDETEQVDFGELHIFVGEDFVITVRHASSPDLARVRRRLEDDPELLARGGPAVLYAIVDAVVDQYLPVVAGVENDVDEIEGQVFDGDPEVSRRVYELSREVVDFQRAVTPLGAVLEALAGGFDHLADATPPSSIPDRRTAAGAGPGGPAPADPSSTGSRVARRRDDEELPRLLRDVADHVAGVNERIESLRALLRDLLQVNSILVAQRQNEEMTALARISNAQNDEVKKISAWAAIAFTPAAIASIYGMNFTHMPELGWCFGYPMAIGIMIAVGVILYVLFRRRGWL